LFECRLTLALAIASRPTYNRRTERNVNASTHGSNPGSRSSDFANARDNVTDALNRGKAALFDAASSLASDASNDVESLRRDLNSLKDTVSRFISQTGEVSSSVANQVSGAASDLAERGASVASAAKDQAKTFASELETMGRRNPLGAMAAAVMVGVLIGLVSRGRSNS
jgi:ElaB/YqjD/DUF883 family membrane-anchored ribosome-binding protein